MFWRFSMNKKQQTLAIFSDIEMGAGGPEDDFPHTKYLVDIILTYNDDQYAGTPLSLIFNGDTFDFLKTSYQGSFPHLINESIAVAKFSKISEYHSSFFLSLQEFLSFDPTNRSLVFITGNHDPEILFPAIQKEIISRIGDYNIKFPQFHFDVGPVHIEHGSQQDPLFYVDPDKPFVIHQGETYLNLPWASVAILDVVMSMQSQFYELDRIKPKGLLIEILPELKEYFLSAFWDYWKKDYLREALKSLNPVKKVSWKMISEIVKRSTIFNPEVKMEQFFQKKMYESEKFQLYVLGHEHETRLWSYGNRKVIQLGCFRDEFMLEQGGKKLTPIPKPYLEVQIDNETISRLEIKESICQEQYSFVPLPPHEIRPKVLQLLGSSAERLKSKIDIENQEAKEDHGFFSRIYDKFHS